MDVFKKCVLYLVWCPMGLQIEFKGALYLPWSSNIGVNYSITGKLPWICGESTSRSSQQVIFCSFPKIPYGSNHLLRMVVEPKYYVEKVIGHPNHQLRIWLDCYWINLQKYPGAAI